MRRRALITGATGFVGGHLTERLAAEGWWVRALVRPTSDTRSLERLGVELYRGDLADEAVLRRASAGVDVVFHLAAVTGLRAEKDFARANVEGTRHLVSAVCGAEPCPGRVVYLSSYAACGPAEPRRPRRLSDPPAPLTEYGRSKLAGEAVVREGCAGRAESVIVRAPAVYGPGDHALLPYFRLVRWGVAPAPGGADRELHMIYAPDLAHALLRAAEVPAGTYPVAEPVVYRWSGVVQVMAEVLGRRPLALPLPPALVRAVAGLAEGAGALLRRGVGFNREKARELLAPAWVCDLTGSEALLSAGEATPLPVGVARTVEWYTRQGWL
jgi:nucleoside-diphosphate-sugar epimerase